MYYNWPKKGALLILFLWYLLKNYPHVLQNRDFPIVYYKESFYLCTS